MRKILVTMLLGIFLISTVSAASWHTTNQDYVLQPEDEESGVDDTYYCIDQADSCEPREDGQEYNQGDTITVSDEGINFLRHNTKDNIGNVEETNSKTVKLDFTKPVTSTNYSGEWQNTPITVSLSCEDPENPDASGCDTTELCKGNSCSLSQGTQTTFSSEGVNVLRYRSTDVAGKVENTDNQDVNIDYTEPVVAVQKETLSSDAMNATVTCTDDLSGCDEQSQRLQVSETSALSCPTDHEEYNEGSTFEVNQHLWVCAAAKDEAGNWDYSSEPVEFSVGTLTTNLDYPGKPGAVVTNVESAIPITLEVGNEEDDKDRTLNISLEGPTQFTDGDTWKEIDLNGVEDRTFNFIAQPEQVGNSTVTVNIREKTEGFTVTKEIEIKARERSSRTSSAGREAPGIGLLQIAVLGLIASTYYLAGRNW